MTFVPNSGPLNASVINAVFSLGEDFNLYHGTKWYYPGNLTNGNFNTSTLKLSDFYGKQPNDPATSGVYFANTAGSGSFTVPLYRNTITIEIWGAGGGGGGVNGSDGTNGGDSSITSYQIPSSGTVTVTYVAGGGGGGKNGQEQIPPPPLPVDTGHNGGELTASGGYYGYGGGYGTDTGSNTTAQGPGPGGTYGHI